MEQGAEMINAIKKDVDRHQTMVVRKKDAGRHQTKVFRKEDARGRMQRGCQRHQTKVASHTEKPLGFSKWLVRENHTRNLAGR